jgi:hypothetical protein
MFKSENFLLTFFQYPPKISPPLVGGDEGEGGPKGLYSVCPPPPSPSPIEKGEGNRWGNFKYVWLEIIWDLGFGFWNLRKVILVKNNLLFCQRPIQRNQRTLV